MTGTRSTMVGRLLKSQIASLWVCGKYNKKGRHEMKRILLQVSCILIVTGCASSGVVPIGKDTFMISDRGHSGMTSAGSLKAGIYREGMAYCASEGKEFQPIHEQWVECVPNTFHWASAEIQFRCLNKNDPELSRPTMKPEANIRIESDVREKKDIQIKDSSNKNTGDMYTELKKLKELLDSNVITQDEFNAQKKIILDKYK
jgi:hypothetical protein